jgi:hypothetical protein
MMRYLLMAAAALMLLGGCTSKSLKVGGMICPPGHTEEMVHQDFRECRVYDEKAAERASRPKQVPQECIECLQERGYTVDGE